jgi:hypothetical protein
VTLALRQCARGVKVCQATRLTYNTDLQYSVLWDSSDSF